MKSFTERNPVVIGVIVIALILAATLGALALTGGVFTKSYALRADFTDAAGLKPGDKVRLAGVLSGAVSHVREASGGKVEVELTIRGGTQVPADSRAAIIVESLLGQKYVRLVPGGDWGHLLRGGDRITRTQTPTEVLDIQNISGPLFRELDAKSLNDLLTSLATITKDKRQDVAALIDGLERLTATVDQHRDQTAHLVDSTRSLVSTVANRDQQLVSAIDNLNTVVGSLAARRAELVALLHQTEAAAAQTADVVGANRARLDAVLNELHRTIAIVDRHQVDLAQGLSYLGVAIEGFASVGYSGPTDYPNKWANLYTELLGPTSPDALYGSCGVIDNVLDNVLGPDPLSCNQRTGPLPGQAAALPASAAAPRRGTTGTGRTVTARPPAAPSIEDSLNALFVPLLAGR